MAGKLILKNVVKPESGKMYYVKNGSLYVTTMNRKGGKKGVARCGVKKAAKKTVKKAVKKVAKKTVKKAAKKATKKTAKKKKK